MKKNIKAVVVMLSIILICGGILAIFSDLLSVSSEERIQRAINNIYTTETVELDKEINIEDYDMSQYNDKGTVKACYLLKNGDYLVLTTGKKGYSNGTVTTYVAIRIESEIPTVIKTVQDSYAGQTLMAKVATLYDKFTGKTSNQDLDSISEFETGATKSSTAISNSVYVSLQFVNLAKEAD